jgi:hypothetical protein
VQEPQFALVHSEEMTKRIDYYQRKASACEAAAAAAEDENVRRAYLLLADEWRAIIREVDEHHIHCNRG